EDDQGEERKKQMRLTNLVFLGCVLSAFGCCNHQLGKDGGSLTTRGIGTLTIPPGAFDTQNTCRLETTVVDAKTIDTFDTSQIIFGISSTGTRAIRITLSRCPFQS